MLHDTQILFTIILIVSNIMRILDCLLFKLVYQLIIIMHFIDHYYTGVV